MRADENSLTLATQGYTRDLKVHCPLVFRGIGFSAGHYHAVQAQPLQDLGLEAC